MSFRDEVDAARARRDALRNALEASADPEVARELAVIEVQIDDARGRAALKVLQDVRIATPCPASWAAMVGDDSVRRCALCEKNVYDFSGLTAVEAVHLLAEREGDACVRLHRRRDGTLITADCEVGRRRRRKRWLQGAAVSLVVGGAAAIASARGERSAHVVRAAQSPSERYFDQEAFVGGPRVLDQRQADAWPAHPPLIRSHLGTPAMGAMLGDRSSEEALRWIRGTDEGRGTLSQDADEDDATVLSR